jgi:Domain of unknown function (DUF2935)
MWSPSNMPGHFAEDRTRAMLLPPEQFAAPPESLSEKMFIERSLTENKFWLRIMKEHALFLGDGMNRNDKDLIQQTERFYHYFEQQEKRAHQTPESVTAVRKLNEDSIQLVYGFRNFKRNLLINGKVQGFNFPLLVDHIAREAEYFMDSKCH